MSKSIISWLKTSTALSSALFVLMSGNSAFANPLDGKVVAGEATISEPDSKTLQVDQHSQKAVVDWRRFDIAPDETTRFVQPNSNAWILNRIVGSQNPSLIQGAIEANGNVAIVNPDGIVFSQGSRVDVNSLIATTHDIANDDFMAGRMNFNLSGNPAASVINEGTISIGDYGLGAFVAPGVRNSGVITAKFGAVTMAAGNEFSLDLYGDGLVSLAVDDEIINEVFDVATGKPIADLVKNEGTIKVDGGTVALKAATARRAVNSVINNTGVIEAKTIGSHKGKIVLGAQTTGTKIAQAPRQKVKVSGRIQTVALPQYVPIPTQRPQIGGNIEITGEWIEVAYANIDASGAHGGGTVLIGGDYLGGNGSPAIMTSMNVTPEEHDIPTATFLTVDDNTSIQANAINNGNGGKVILWSDNATFAHGKISATGGETSGNGGFIETSGKNYLDAGSMNFDASAKHGQAGNILLDPGNIKIVENLPSVGINLFPIDSFDTFPFVAENSTTIMKASAISKVLSAGSNITIQTQAEGDTWSGPISRGIIDIKANIIKTGRKEATLSLFAGNVINLHDGVKIAQSGGPYDSFGSLNVYLDADYDRLGYGLIDLRNNSKIATNGGFLIMNGHQINRFGEINISRGAIDDVDDGLLHIIHLFNEVDVNGLKEAELDGLLPWRSGLAGKPITSATSEEELRVFKIADSKLPKLSIITSLESVDKATTIESALLANLAYEGNSYVRQWLSDRGYTPVLHLHDERGNDAYLASKEYNNEKVYNLFIRGTEFGVDGDVSRDGHNLDKVDPNIKGGINSGFYGLADSVYTKFFTGTAGRARLDEIKNGTAKLNISGHSLGGAAAQILLVMISERNEIENINTKIQANVFGSPTLGSNKFMSTYSGLNVKRFINPGDEVADGLLTSGLGLGNRIKLKSEGINLANEHGLLNYIKKLSD